MLAITDAASMASRRINVKPNLVFSIEGLESVYGAEDVQRYIRIGDPGLVIGNAWKIGGLTLLETSSPYVSFTQGGATTSKMTQQLSPDRSQGTSATTVVVSILDKGERISQLISPGFDLAEILGANALIKLGFVDTLYPDDYVTMFRGIIQSVDSSPGMIHFTLASTEAKKNVPSFATNTTLLTTGFLAGDAAATIYVDDNSVFVGIANGPDGSPDTSITRYVRIDDEIFKYTGLGANSLTGVSRAQLGSIAADHDAEAEVSSLYTLEGNGIDLALKVMLSGWNGPFAREAISSFNTVGPTDYVDTLYFDGLDIEDLYGVTPGDYAVVAGATTSGNNVSARVSAVEKINGGSIVVLGGAGFVSEAGGNAVVDFRSQYDSLTQGLKMKPSEVDVAEHQRLQSVFLGNIDFEFTFNQIPDTKKWIEQQIYLPMACFSIPRKGRSSLALTVGPIPGDVVPTLDTTNVKNANTLKLSRSLASNFNNTIIYRYDFDYLLGKYLINKTYESADSLTRIPLGASIMDIKSQGIKSDLDAATITDNAAAKLLGRYQYGAEYIKGIKLQWSDGFPLEIGDIVIVDLASLKMTDTRVGTRSGGKKLFEIINKSIDIKTGDVELQILSTSFLLEDRFATISPSSLIDTGATTVRLPLQRSFGTASYQRESTKWIDYVGETILLHSEDWSYSEETTILGLDTTVSPEVMVVATLSGAPPVDTIIDVANYPDTSDPDTNARWKAQYGFLSPSVTPVSASDESHITVAPADIDKFLVGALVRIHSANFANDSGELEVTDVDTGTNVITLSSDAGFSITSSHIIDLIGFKDGGAPYRWL